MLLHFSNINIRKKVLLFPSEYFLKVCKRKSEKLKNVKITASRREKDGRNCAD
jgi:hypothetical protein